MATEIKSNLILINAPAGSGKTTTIEKNVIKTLSNFPNSKILCITYTNRAAEELLFRINNSNVQIQTIHSYINEFIKVYFSHKEVLDLYFEIYRDKIKSEIENKAEDSNIKKKNDKYKEKYNLKDEQFCIEIIKKNINKIEYNELAFDSLYYGGLGHDSLLEFTKEVMGRFPVLKKRIFDKFDYIYIDEYQDTSAVVLNIFYNAVKGTKTKLYLLGDKMQQIYKNYDGSFEEELQEFDSSRRLDTNYRSSAKIVDVLNKIYNDKDYEQHPSEKAITDIDCKKPVVIITNDVESTLKDKTIIGNTTLKLYVFNSYRFKTINAENLYTAIDNMKKYRFPSKYSAVEVLTNEINDNPDELMRSLLIISDTIEKFCEKKHGLVVQAFKNNKILNYSKLKVNFYSDKIVFEKEMLELSNEYNNKNHTIKTFLDMMIEKNLLNKERFISAFENQEYENFLKVDMNEFKNLKEYRKQPYVSTQHGVKGEGYDSVCFVAENSSNPPIRIFEFMELFCKNNINLTSFQKFYYDYKLKIERLEEELKCNFSKLKAPDFEMNEKKFTEFLQQTQLELIDNIYFNFIFNDLFNKYFKKPNKTNIEKCLKFTKVFGMLTAYRLFYVGCSRARKELIIVIDEDKIEKFKEDFKIKMKSIGFDVQ